MKNKWFIFILGLVVFNLILSFKEIKTTPVTFVVPQGWQKPVYDFSKNPLTQEGFELGRHLFYDPILSRDNSISCASCHLQATGFTHVDHDLSHGIDGKIGTRNSLPLMNLAWNKSFMWDGGVNHLDVQPLVPMSSAIEMDEKLPNIIKKLNDSEKYRKLFYKAFSDSAVTGQKMLLALSQFVVQLQSHNSKYDKFIRKEPGVEFTEQELNGLKLFRTHCASCHTEPLFTNQNFENNGLPIDTTLNDFGRMRITHNPSDSLKFKVPTLRNIQFSYPYMHDGRFKKLRDVINHYNRGIQVGQTLSPQLQHPINLSPNDKVDIIAFLLTLTDREFLFDQRFSFPKE